MKENLDPNKPYGQGDATFQAAGGEAGIRRLVDRFYDLMSTQPEYATIWSWHPDDPELSRDKLARFLCGWTGGPKRYSEKYGSIRIPAAHAHLDVTHAEKNQWLSCMKQALEDLDYPEDFRTYLINALTVPAESIRLTASARAGRLDPP
ncbi:MAG: group II truncated hemoglobin [Pseudomonadota bacterium]